MSWIVGTDRTKLFVLLALLFATSISYAQEPAALIHIRNLEFDPLHLEVPVGTAVTWRNESERAHTLVSAEDRWEPVLLEPGVSYTRFFEQPGEHLYYSEAHGTPEGTGMAGRVVVSAAGGIPVTGSNGPVIPALTVTGQKSNGSAVVVGTVSSSESGFVVIHPTGTDGQADLKTSFGHRTVPEGSTRHLVIPIDPTIQKSQTLFATLHTDQDGNGTYSYPGDAPVEVSGRTISAPFLVTVGPETLPPAGRQSRPYLISLLGLLVAMGGLLLRRSLASQETATPNHRTLP